jgi:hypothetical protein
MVMMSLYRNSHMMSQSDASFWRAEERSLGSLVHYDPWILINTTLSIYIFENGRNGIGLTPRICPISGKKIDRMVLLKLSTPSTGL